MKGEPRKYRFLKRLERLKKARSQTVSTRKKIAAAALAGGMAVLTLYLIFIIVGVADLGWQFAPLAAGLGALLGLCAGIRATSAGIAMGILAGIWIFFEVVALGVVLILEGLAVVLAAALSIFG